MPNFSLTSAAGGGGVVSILNDAGPSGSKRAATVSRPSLPHKNSNESSPESSGMPTPPGASYSSSGSSADSGGPTGQRRYDSEYDTPATSVQPSSGEDSYSSSRKGKEDKAARLLGGEAGVEAALGRRRGSNDGRRGAEGAHVLKRERFASSPMAMEEPGHQSDQVKPVAEELLDDLTPRRKRGRAQDGKAVSPELSPRAQYHDQLEEYEAGPSSRNELAPPPRPVGSRSTASVINGKKRYPCSYPGCNKTFSTSGHAARHHRIHTGRKPYRCTFPGCNASFSRQDNSLQHYRTHVLHPKARAAGAVGMDVDPLSADPKLMDLDPETEASVRLGRKALEEGTAIAVVHEVYDRHGRRGEAVQRTVGQPRAGGPPTLGPMPPMGMPPAMASGHARPYGVPPGHEEDDDDELRLSPRMGQSSRHLLDGPPPPPGMRPFDPNSPQQIHHEHLHFHHHHHRYSLPQLHGLPPSAAHGLPGRREVSGPAPLNLPPPVPHPSHSPTRSKVGYGPGAPHPPPGYGPQSPPGVHPSGPYPHEAHHHRRHPSFGSADGRGPEFGGPRAAASAPVSAAGPWDLPRDERERALSSTSATDYANYRRSASVNPSRSAISLYGAPHGAGAPESVSSGSVTGRIASRSLIDMPHRASAFYDAPGRPPPDVSGALSLLPAGSGANGGAAGSNRPRLPSLTGVPLPSVAKVAGASRGPLPSAAAIGATASKGRPLHLSGPLPAFSQVPCSSDRSTTGQDLTPQTPIEGFALPVQKQAAPITSAPQLSHLSRVADAEGPIRLPPIRAPSP